MDHISNLVYPPQNYQDMTIDGGGFTEFGELLGIWWWCLGAPWRRRSPRPRPGLGAQASPSGPGPLVGLAGHPLLGQHSARGVVHGRQQMRGRVSLVRAPHMVLPSTTTTLRSSMVPVRVCDHDYDPMSHNT